VLNYVLILASVVCLLTSILYGSFLTAISHFNYPGGNALQFFNEDFRNEMIKEPELPTPYIHVDVYPAMTGITRFSYENEDIGWRYNRTEHLEDS